MPLADIHIGDPLLDEKLLKQTIEYIKDNNNVFNTNYGYYSCGNIDMNE